MREFNLLEVQSGRSAAGLHAGCISREEKRRLLESVVCAPAGRCGRKSRFRAKSAVKACAMTTQAVSVNASNCANARGQDLLDGYITLARQGVLLRGCLY